jgi:hypothetical protein
MSIKDVFQDVDVKERTINYIQLAKNIADNYGYSHTNFSNKLSHGIQKDAIQNAWDAKVKKSTKFVSEFWRFNFELLTLRDGNNALIMTDAGTYGLTGNLTCDDLKSLSTAAEDLPQDERWARWESFGYTKGGAVLGSRGQGKMIFMLASKEYTIYYDSLRSDSSYRFGYSRATETGCPIVHFIDVEAKQKIRSLLGLEPLSEIGTRIIIIDPVDEVVIDIRNGNLMKFVEETWWPNILKYGANIIVQYDGKSRKASVPKIFPITKDDNENASFKTWVKYEEDLKKLGTKLKIKHLCVACNLEKEIEEFYQGIACFRDGMKVDIIRFPEKSFRNKVYGYVEFDELLEKDLREIEKPSHYEFKGTLWSKIKNLVEQELEGFGNKKLNLSIDRQALDNIKRSNAESKAMSILKAVTKNWLLSKHGKGIGGGGSNGGDSPKMVGARLSNLKFPNPGNIPRLDYGQNLDGFDVVAFNKTDKLCNLKIDIFILSGNRRIIDLKKKSIELKSHSHFPISGLSFDVENTSFESAGEYKLRANLTDMDTNQRIDRITRRFWVETDPELTGPFEVKKLNFNDIPDTIMVNKSREWYLSNEGDGKYVLYYNYDHPAFLYNDENESKLTGYLAEIFLMGALELLIRQGSAKDEDDTEVGKKPLDFEKISSGNPIETYSEYTLALSKIRKSMYGFV